MILAIVGSLVAILIAISILLALLKRRAKSKKKDQQTVLILLGSGGHTTEMCELMREFNFKKCAQVYIISGTSDKLSEAFFLNYLSEVR